MKNGLKLMLLFILIITMIGCNGDETPSKGATPVDQAVSVDEQKEEEANNGVEKEVFITDKRPEQGYLAPDFSFVSQEGNEISLSDLKGKPVFLNFWASW